MIASINALFKGQINHILKKVSRSLYLSLRILPRKIREPLALGYLLARSADTISDTKIIPTEKRLEWLLKFKRHILQADTQTDNWDHFENDLIGPQNSPEEKWLLSRLLNLLNLLWHINEKDRQEIQIVLRSLIHGMEKDLKYFSGDSPQHIQALRTSAELDQYCYYAAGVVGPFWTRVLLNHYPEWRLMDPQQMEKWSIDYGKGLQLINVIKDIAHDYQAGRCYLPEDEINLLGIKPVDFSRKELYSTLKPLLLKIVQQSLEYLSSANHYITHLPRRCYSIRLATLLPQWIGLASLDFLLNDQSLLDPQKPHKITKIKLRMLLLKSFFAVLSNKCLDKHFKQYQNKIMFQIKGTSKKQSNNLQPL